MFEIHVLPNGNLRMSDYTYGQDVVWCRVWHRLAYRNGGEDIIDLAVYRYGVTGKALRVKYDVPHPRRGGECSQS